ncbi:hypothetical protein B0A50_06965 [Salinomyces thailandicus]|uniref:Glyoxalase-like domain-containing protein n=1 Tax=Salinomyces thailandicus TaxID=706561 RepID=A0A4U0TP73_9PEZI|nr:hypothetical protein B0A50_06965 [Salinomyces thailandica]
MPKSEVLLDHVVLLLPYEQVVNPPSWIANSFHISPGGRHADGKTENKLILFRDGSYLELIAFIHDDPARRKGHCWDKDYGVVDFALTTRHQFDHATLRERLQKSGANFSYADPVEGGRKTPDRQELRWKLTCPVGVERGMVPFWCSDLTPRERRVPGVNGNTHHPCGAVGISGVVIEVADGNYDRLKTALAAITNTTPTDPGRYPISTPFEIGRPDQPTIWLRQRPLDGEKELRLRLLIQCPGRGSQPNIERKVGGGLVAIDLVNGTRPH